MSAKRPRWIVAIVAVATAVVAWRMTRQLDVQQTDPTLVDEPVIASDRADENYTNLTLPDTREVAPPRHVPEEHDAHAALRLGLPLIQQAAANYPKHRKCFSCHHQTLPMLVMVAAPRRGWKLIKSC